MWRIRLLNHPMYKDYWFVTWARRPQTTDILDATVFTSKAEADKMAALVVEGAGWFYYGIAAAVERAYQPPHGMVTVAYGTYMDGEVFRVIYGPL